MPAHASRTLAPAPSTPPSRAERRLLAPVRPRHRRASAATPAERSASPAARPVKLRSVDSGVGVAAVVVHGDVQVVEADTAGARGLAGASVDAVSAAVGDARQFLHVEVRQVAGCGVLVAQLLPAHTMQLVEAVEAKAPEHGVDGGAGEPERPGDAVRPEPRAAAHGADAPLQLGCGARRGWWCGAGLRSSSPATPASRKRRTHFATVGREIRKRHATSVWDQPASTSRTSSSRVTGVRRALRCATRGSSPATGACNTHSSRRGLSPATTYLGTTARWASLRAKRITSSAPQGAQRVNCPASSMERRAWKYRASIRLFWRTPALNALARYGGESELPRLRPSCSTRHRYPMAAGGPWRRSRC